MSSMRALTPLLPLAGLRWRDLVVPVLAGTAMLLSALTLTVVSAWLITRAWEMPPILDLTVAVTAVRALGISRAVFRYVDRLVTHRLALHCASTGRVNAYRMLATARPASTASLGRGEVTTRLTADIDSVADVVVRVVVPALVSLLTGALSVVFTALLSVPAAVVLAVGLLVAGVFAPWAVHRSVEVAETVRARQSVQFASAVDRILTDAVSLRIRGQLGPVLRDARHAAHELSQAVEAGAPSRAYGTALSVLASSATAVGVLLVGVLGYAAGGTPVHSPQWLGVLVLLSLAAFEATAQLPEAALAMSRASGAARRLADMLHTDPCEAHGADSESLVAAVGPEPGLRAVDMVYGHDSDLGTLNLEVPFGSFRSFTGASGSGKTTLLLTLAGLIPPRAGEVQLGDRDLHDLVTSDSGAVHRTISYLPEDARVFATTVRDNLAVGAPAATDEQMYDILGAVGLGSWAASLPYGLSTILTTGAESLSGGQRRRLLIARMLLTDAPILLLDEPFEHLDSRGEGALDDLLSAPVLPGTRKQRTVIIARHPRRNS